MKFRQKYFRVEQLEQRQVMTATVLEVEPNGSPLSANVVAVNSGDTTTILGNSQNRNDNDYFRFAAEVSGTVTVRVASLSGVESEFRATDASGTNLVRTTIGDATPVTESFHVNAGESYRLRYRNRGRRVDSPYELDVSLQADSPNPSGNLFTETENNNRARQADAFELGSDGIAELQGVSVNKQDNDFFVFTAVQGGRLSVRVDSTGAAAKLQIEDAAGNKVLETEPNNGINTASGNLVEGTTYYVRLRSVDNVAAADYHVALTLNGGSTGAAVNRPTGPTGPTNDDGTPDQGPGDVGGTTNPTTDDGTPDQGPGDAGGTTVGGGVVAATVVSEIEANNRPSTANFFSVPATGLVSLSGVSANKDDKDFFGFVSDRTASVDVHLTNVDRAFADLEIEDAAGRAILKLEPNNGTSAGHFRIVAGQTYLIRLRAKDKVAAAYLADLVFGTV